MNRVVGLLLIAVGLVVLFSGGISSGKTTPVDRKLAPFELAVEDRSTTDFRTWGGLGAIAAGGALLLVHRRSREKSGAVKV